MIGRLVSLFGFIYVCVVLALEIVNVAGIPSRGKLVDYRDGISHPNRIFLLLQAIEDRPKPVTCSLRSSPDHEGRLAVARIGQWPLTE